MNEYEPRSHADEAPHIAMLGEDNDVVIAWLMREKPFGGGADNAATLSALCSNAGIKTPTEAVKALAGIAGKSTIYEWWKRPLPISWTKLDQIFWKLFQMSDSEGQNTLVLCMEIIAEDARNDADEIRRAMWEEEIASIARGLDMRGLATLVDVARALELSQKATLAAIEDGAKPVPFSGRLA